MPEKYHIKTKPVPPRLPRIGKVGVVEWREDCARCHNCVKKACVFDRYREETRYIRGLNDVDAIYYDCQGCFSCVQKCTKGILALSANPAYEQLGNRYWTPDIIQSTWNQAETAKIPVSGGGYRGRFSGPGFDDMWTDMSEIVRPTRDGIHGREYISTAVDIGRKVPLIDFQASELSAAWPPIVDIPLPLVIDMLPPQYPVTGLIPVFKAVAAQTGILVIVNSRDYDQLASDRDRHLSSVAFYFAEGAPLLPSEILRQTRLAEIADGPSLEARIQALKAVSPTLVVSVRVPLDARGVERSIELGNQPFIEALHLVADYNGNQIGVPNPLFVKDMLRQVHNSLVKSGVRDQITLIAGGGIALAEHLAKQIICGADVVSIEMPLLISLECQVCRQCRPDACPARLNEVTSTYGAGRMVNLLAAWHDQLIEVMGAMGIREARRLRGEVGRAMFFSDLEEETFGKLFGTRKTA